MAHQVHRAGSSLLFITHDLGVVASICDRVLIMRHGRIVESGDLDRVFSNPQHPYTRALLAASALETDPSSGRLLTPGPTGGDAAYADRAPVPSAAGIPVSEGARPQGSLKPAPHQILERPSPMEGGGTGREITVRDVAAAPIFNQRMKRRCSPRVRSPGPMAGRECSAVAGRFRPCAECPSTSGPGSVSGSLGSPAVGSPPCCGSHRPR